MLLEWAAITLAGAVGGFLGAIFLRIGAEVSWPEPLSDYFDAHPAISFLGHILRSTVLGGAASWLLWALYNPAANFSSLGAAPLQIATAALIGAGGVSAVDRLIRERQEQKTIDTQADTIIELGQQLLEQTDGEAGGNNGEDQ